MSTSTNLKTVSEGSSLEGEQDDKKIKVDYFSIFSAIKTGKHNLDEVEFVEISGRPANTVFRFTERGIKKYRDGLQKLFRDNYKKLREIGVIPYGENSEKQKVSYSRRLFQFEETVEFQTTSITVPQISVPQEQVITTNKRQKTNQQGKVLLFLVTVRFS
jgi:hypothetical protein